MFCMSKSRLAKRRVKRGARFLDKRFGPGWEKRIDVERLDMAGFGSLLQQLTGTVYWRSTLSISPRQSVRLGFEPGFQIFPRRGLHDVPWGTLDDAWKNTIRNRLKGDRDEG